MKSVLKTEYVRLFETAEEIIMDRFDVSFDEATSIIISNPDIGSKLMLISVFDIKLSEIDKKMRYFHDEYITYVVRRQEVINNLKKEGWL